jgi:hypothetical protein
MAQEGASRRQGFLNGDLALQNPMVTSLDELTQAMQSQLSRAQHILQRLQSILSGDVVVLSEITDLILQKKVGAG